MSEYRYFIANKNKIGTLVRNNKINGNDTFFADISNLKQENEKLKKKRLIFIIIGKLDESVANVKFYCVFN